MRDKVIGGDADQRIDEVEGQKVGGDEHPETAGHRQQPRDREAVGVGPARAVGQGEDAANEPNQRRGGEQHAPRQIESQAHAQRRQLDAKGFAGDREHRGCERGHRSERRHRPGDGAQPDRQGGREDHERRGQRGDQEAGAERVRRRGEGAHCSGAPAPGRPIWTKAKNPAGAKASRTAISARARAMLSRPRSGAFFNGAVSPERAGASTR